MCKLTDVLGIEIQDRVGELNRLLTALDESNINVNYMYLSFNRESGSPVMVFHTNDITEVEECLTAKGFCGRALCERRKDDRGLLRQGGVTGGGISG